MLQKRDGLVENWNTAKVENAIFKAAVSAGVDEYTARNIAVEKSTRIAEKYSSKDVTVEEVQDAVEKELMQSKWKDVAAHYVAYRSSRDTARNNKGKIAQVVRSILDKSDPDILFENANLNSKTLTTERAMIMSEVSKILSDDLLPEEIVKAHNEGFIHHHDKNFAPLQAYTNCCLIDLKNMLELGTKVGGASIESPKSIGVATAVAAQVIAQVSSSQYGKQICRV